MTPSLSESSSFFYFGLNLLLIHSFIFWIDLTVVLILLILLQSYYRLGRPLLTLRTHVDLVPYYLILH
jgi:hypothetical protein